MTTIEIRIQPDEEHSQLSDSSSSSSAPASPTAANRTSSAPVNNRAPSTLTCLVCSDVGVSRKEEFGCQCRECVFCDNCWSSFNAAVTPQRLAHGLTCPTCRKRKIHEEPIHQAVMTHYGKNCFAGLILVFVCGPLYLAAQVVIWSWLHLESPIVLVFTCLALSDDEVPEWWKIFAVVWQFILYIKIARPRSVPRDNIEIEVSNTAWLAWVNGGLISSNRRDPVTGHDIPNELYVHNREVEAAIWEQVLPAMGVLKSELTQNEFLAAVRTVYASANPPATETDKNLRRMYNNIPEEYLPQSRPTKTIDDEVEVKSDEVEVKTEEVEVKTEEVEVKTEEVEVKTEEVEVKSDEVKTEEVVIPPYSPRVVEALNTLANYLDYKHVYFRTPHRVYVMLFHKSILSFECPFTYKTWCSKLVNSINFFWCIVSIVAAFDWVHTEIGYVWSLVVFICWVSKPGLLLSGAIALLLAFLSALLID